MGIVTAASCSTFPGATLTMRAPILMQSCTVPSPLCKRFGDTHAQLRHKHTRLGQNQVTLHNFMGDYYNV